MVIWDILIQLIAWLATGIAFIGLDHLINRQFDRKGNSND